jgi:hypothetical protein
MKDKLLNEATILRYKLDQIETLNSEECIDALQLLNYLLRRAETYESRNAMNTYIQEINKRMAGGEPGFSAE